ncbi:MAG: hypothetical protein ACHQE6_00160 [Solirubrobacterales bacterium]
MSAIITDDELAAIRASTRMHLDELGTLTVREVWRSAIPSGEVWVAVLDRPGCDAPQVACMTLQASGEGPVAVDALLTGTGPASELDSALAQLTEGAERSTVHDLTERLRATIANMNEAQLAAPMEAGVCLPILARAISGDAGALGHVITYPELEEEDEEHFPVDDMVEEALLDALVRDYGRYVCDEHDPVAGEAWIAAYDMRQLAAGDDPRGHTPPARRRAASATRVKRTAAKQARRRNRSIRRK